MRYTTKPYVPSGSVSIAVPPGGHWTPLQASIALLSASAYQIGCAGLPALLPAPALPDNPPLELSPLPPADVPA